MSLLCPGCLGQFSFLQHSNAKNAKVHRYFHFCRSKRKFTKRHLNSTQTFITISNNLTKNYLLLLTPSGFTTLVTVTDWKKDRLLGWFGVWPAGGAKIWSRPPEDTAESRSEKCVKESVLSLYFTSLSEGFNPTSVLSPRILWKLLWSLIPNIIELWTKLVQYCHHSNQVVEIKD